MMSKTTENYFKKADNTFYCQMEDYTVLASPYIIITVPVKDAFVSLPTNVWHERNEAGILRSCREPVRVFERMLEIGSWIDDCKKVSVTGVVCDTKCERSVRILLDADGTNYMIDERFWKMVAPLDWSHVITPGPNKPIWFIDAEWQRVVALVMPVTTNRQKYKVVLLSDD